MNSMLTEFAKRSTGASLALAVMATAAQAGPSHTINFNGHALNCATLQGTQDPIPNNLTCGFIQEVEQYIKGPKLVCPSDVEGNTFSAMQNGARHMAVSHNQDAIFHYLEALVARYAATRNGTDMMAELGNTHPGEERDFALTHILLDQTLLQLEKGATMEAAMSHAVSYFTGKGWDVPGEGTGLAAFNDLLRKNPVAGGFLACRAAFAQPTWPTFESRR